MIIARILLGFILIIHKNQELVNTIKNILKIFPEGIIIQSIDHNSKTPIVQFINDSAAKDIISYSNPVGKPIFDEKLDYILKEAKEQVSGNDSYQEHGQEVNRHSLFNFLWNHQEQINEENKVVSSSIELHRDSGSSGHDNMHFKVKSMKVKWGSYK